MPTPLTNLATSEERARAHAIFNDVRARQNRSTDRVFAILMMVQWLACILAALVISPRTWIGTSGMTHLHLWGSICIGGLLTLYPAWLAIFRSGLPLTRHVIAAAQMCWSALLIHVTGGRIETHFHVFGSLAFLAFYRDWRVLATATVVIAFDHAVRGIWWPMSAFGVAGGSQWRWVEHAGWVVFENIILVASCRRGVHEVREMANIQAGLEGSFHRTELEVEHRTGQLREANARAEGASRAKSEFLANMSHEIRTPLTAILGYTDLLRDEPDATDTRAQRAQHVNTIRAAGQHLLTVINDILDLSKIEADRMTVESMDTPVLRVLAEVESLVRPRAAAKGVSLTVALGTPVPDRVLSDPTRLRQILMNLAGNAAKFTQRGHVIVTASATTAQRGPRLVIDIEDTGPGMTPEQSDRLFSPFNQADTTVTRQHGGTGLGLTISRRLARLMGGDVSLIWSESGKGSCFRLDLPLVPVQGASEVASLDSVRTQAQAARQQAGPKLAGRILLAEDGADNQRLIAFHLRKAGATVDVADNGRLALQALDQAAARGQPYALLLTDMQMPEMDGYTLARTLRQRGDTIPIVALTAHAMAEDRDRCLAAGCNDYTTKPIDKRMLIATCAKWMGTPAAQPTRREAA